MTKLAHGTIFAAPLPDGAFLCGRVMLDIYGCLKRRLFPADSPLPGLGKAYLVEMYSAVVPTAAYAPSPLLIPGAYVESYAVGEAWPVVGYKAVDPRTVEFPESLIGHHHDDGVVAFRCGEIRILLPYTQHDYVEQIGEYSCRHSAFLWPYTCLRTMGRGQEVPAGYKMASLSGSDLRFSPHRREIYESLPFPMEETYYQKQARMGLNLDRLYE